MRLEQQRGMEALDKGSTSVPVHSERHTRLSGGAGLRASPGDQRRRNALAVVQAAREGMRDNDQSYLKGAVWSAISLNWFGGDIM